MPRPNTGTWWMDYSLDEGGTFSVHCPYCGDTITLGRLSACVLAGVAHSQTCRERNAR